MTSVLAAPDPIRRHLRFGWWALLAFLSLGVVLEALHGFKVRWYLDVENDARRLQWTLGHAHGTLLALINIAYAFGLRALGDDAGRVSRGASTCTIWAGVLMPAGFLLGGAFTLGPDPGPGVALVPIGAVLLFIGVLSMARATDVLRSGSDAPAEAGEAAAPKPKKGKSKQGTSGWSGPQ